MPVYGINDAVLWLHADLKTTLAKTAGETSIGLGDIASGNQIYRWFDDSGHSNAANHTAIQLATTYQPTFWDDGSGLNAKPFVCFNAPGAAPGAGAATGAVLNIGDAAPGLLEILDGQGAGGPGAGKGSYTVLMLVRQRTFAGSGTGYSTLATNRNGNNQFVNFIRSPASTAGGLLKRFNSTLQAPFDQNVPLAFALTFSCNGTANQGTEQLYVNDAAAPVAVSTLGRPALVAPYNTWFLGAETATGGKCFTNGEVYEILAFSRDLNNAEIAAIFAAWNGKYALSLGASVGPLTAGTLSASNITQTTQTISSTPPVGGTAPYTYQLYRSTAAGALGSPIAGATGLLTNDSGLSAQTTYYYTLRITDSLGAVVDTAQIAAPTHGTYAVRIGFIGNSQMTQEPGGETIPEAYARLFFTAYRGADPIITNLAVSGQQARHVAQTNGGGNLLAGYLTTLTTAGVTHCFVLHGGNDATQQADGTAGYSPTDYAEDMTDILSRLVAAGITPIVCETPYRSNYPAADVIVRDSYNPLLPGLCNGTTILMGDQAVYEEWLANPSLYLRDGLHPTASGVVRWAELLMAVTPLSLLPPATGFTFTGPAGGAIGVAAGPYTVTPVGGKFTGTVTPNDAGGGGSFSPTSLSFSNGITGQTFTYTPAGGGGTRTLSITSNPALPPPQSLLFSTPDNNPPTVSAAEILASGTQLQITFSEPVTVLDSTKFTVAGKTLSSWSLSGDGLRLTATISPIVYGGAAALSLVVAAGAVEDLSGNDIAGATVSITNNSTASAVSGVQVTPSTASLSPGGQQQFSATVQGSGSPSQEVTWSVLEVGGGTISTLGVYTAPSVPGTYTVRAQSVQDPGKVGAATVTVAAAPSGAGAIAYYEGPLEMLADGSVSGRIQRYGGDPIGLAVQLRIGGRRANLSGYSLTASLLDGAGDSAASVTVAADFAQGGDLRLTGTCPSAPGTYRLFVHPAGWRTFGPLILEVA